MQWIKIVQIIIAILLSFSILLQNRGASVSGIFGGSDSVYRTKRGIEKTLFYSTIILSILFFGVAIAGVILQTSYTS